MSDYRLQIDDKAKKYLDKKGITTLTIRLIRNSGG
ncbi:hypothetical protein Nther_0660 [Natranaerobius thermophilus JW/NM-WN-LF]|uniref:Uncharacterized protein n=1 Tax=Natranaerobius thermophilus (strain ATCC BAA-1301 / DSM 18059 / JW/NM-WN-LF) TaxID=457570 RepID=B2A760_NATTJ|nr:hypothetical protein Nther_0660 [Natranaerobius thermophilus JW/NM-WN-LF]